MDEFLEEVNYSNFTLRVKTCKLGISKLDKAFKNGSKGVGETAFGGFVQVLKAFTLDLATIEETSYKKYLMVEYEGFCSKTFTETLIDKNTGKANLIDICSKYGIEFECISVSANHGIIERVFYDGEHYIETSQSPYAELSEGLLDDEDKEGALAEFNQTWDTNYTLDDLTSGAHLPSGSMEFLRIKTYNESLIA